MIVTDHNDLKGAFETQKLAREKYDDKIKVLIGFEYVRNFEKILIIIVI